MRSFRRKSLILNRRGQLPKQAMEIIIAVVIIAVLLFGVIKIYSYFANEEKDNAKKTLDIIVAKTGLIEWRETGKFALQGFKGAKNWYVTGWGKDEPDGPQKCAFKSCICICRLEGNAEIISRDWVTLPGSAVSDPQGDYLKEACQNDGLCKILDVDWVTVHSGYPQQEDANEPRTYFPYFQVGDKLKEITITKSRLEREGEEYNSISVAYLPNAV